MDKVLIVEDKEHQRRQVARALEGVYQTYQAGNREGALEIIAKEEVDLVLLDLQLPPNEDTIDEGLLLLKQINGGPVVIVITGNQEKDTALLMMREGAYDYFSKPIDLKEMELTVKRALYKRRLEQENLRLREELQKRYSFANIIAKSKVMQTIFERIRAVSHTDANVLIRGESGVGKELVARAIHFCGPRKDNSFIKVNCAAIPETLLESELFGYRRGAFTGASSDRKGRFESARGGTIFLDEISDMAPSLQAKLLQVLEEKSFYPLGGDKLLQVDVQIISATNKNLEEKVKDGSLREDLYYRLNALNINLPPLRERREDIPLLIDHFLKKHRDNLGLDPEAMAALIDYDWPGNVRELENVVEMGITLSGGKLIRAADLPAGINNRTDENDGSNLTEPTGEGIDLPEEGIYYDEVIRRYGRELLIAALKKNDWSRSGAARTLNLSRDQMKYYFKKYALDEEENRLREELDRMAKLIRNP